MPRNKWQWEMMTENLWDAAKAVLKKKCIAIQFYLKEQEKYWVYNLIIHLKKLQKEEEEEQKKTKLVEGKK